MAGILGSRRRLLLATAAVAVVTAVFRLTVDLRSGGLTGAGSTDDGVHYAAAASLLAGRLPYRDFLFLHPPGIMLALTPFAALGTVIGDGAAFGAARMGGILLGAANTGLVVVVLQRFGLTAALTGAFVYACSWPVVFAERSALLEPVGCALLLMSFALASLEPSRRRTVLAGLALGAAVAVKLTFLPPALIGLIAMRRRGPLAAAAAAVVATLLCAPFLLSSPGAMWQQLVIDQLGRRRIVPLLGLRLAAITMPPVVPGVPQRAVLAGVLAIAAVLVVVGLVTSSARRYAVLFIVEVALLLAAPSFYGHYAVLAVLPLALLAGVAMARLRACTHGAVRVGLSTATAGLLLLTVIGPWTPGRVALLSSPPLPPRLITALRQPGGCASADAATTLVLADVLSRDLARGCTVWPDVTGRQYDRGDHRRAGRSLVAARDPLFQRRVLAYLMSGDVVALTRAKSGLSAATRAEVLRGPELWSGAYGVVHRTPPRSRSHGPSPKARPVR